MCKVCGNNRCIGRYLLHPREVVYLEKLIQTELKACNKRDFILVDSPSSVEVFTKFMELHVIAGPDEDMNDLPEVRVDVSELQELVVHPPIFLPIKSELQEIIDKYKKND